MVNKIIDAISLAINGEFGDEYKIYTEGLEQGLQEPCFFIFCINPKNSHFLNNRYLRVNQFAIHYFPSTPDKNSECHDIAERLYQGLEIIEVNGDMTRGTRMDTTIHDGVLMFFVNYDFFARKVVAKETPMDGLEVNADAKG